ncbi:MAG: hypothetical protein ACOCZZ_00095 [Bacillota bacterium]
MAKSDFWVRVLIDILIIFGIILIITSGISIYLEQTRGYGIFGITNGEDSEENLAEENNETVENLELVKNAKADLVSLQNNFDLNYKRIDEIDNIVEIEIESGMAGLQIASLLDEAGVISYDDFAFLLVEFNLSSRIIADEYILEKNMALSDLFSKILLD